MKKLILSLILGCMCTLAFATKGIATSINSSKVIIKKIKTNGFRASCTQTRSIAVVINGRHVATVSATETFTSPDPTFTCSIAGAMAQNSAQALADDYARKAGATPVIPD